MAPRCCGLAYGLYVIGLLCLLHRTKGLGEMEDQIPVPTVFGPRCLDCEGVADVTECRNTKECWPHETCFAEKILNSTGSVWYNFGCKTTEECSVLEEESRSRRFDVELRTCQKCCNGSVCNIHLCHNNTGVLPCFSCEGVASGRTCGDIAVCKSGEQCYAEKFLEQGLNPLYNLGCAAKLICDAIENIGHHGKRLVESRERTRQRRSTFLCQRCCAVKGCNADVCDNPLTTTPAPTTTGTTANVSMSDTTATPTQSTDAMETTDVTTGASPTAVTNVTTSSKPTQPTSAPTAVPIPVGNDCWELRSVYNVTSDGVFQLERPLANGSLSAWCDMTTDGGGWTVLQRRVYGNYSFNRNWTEFKTGFGDVREAFWWGNENIYEFTRDEPMVLRIDLWDVRGDTMFAEYRNFSLTNSSDFYRLNLGGFRGPAGKIMYYFNTPSDKGSRHEGRRFTTLDRDNDQWVGNCAVYTGGGFWLDECCVVCLNGRYKQINEDLCMGSVIGDLGQILHCVQRIEMKFRPASAPSSIKDSYVTPPTMP